MIKVIERAHQRREEEENRYRRGGGGGSDGGAKLTEFGRYESLIAPGAGGA